MTTHDTRTIPAELITRGRNDRTVFVPAAIANLAASISEFGLAQPPTVRPIFDHPTAEYEIVAGECRFRAMSVELGWGEIPCIVRILTDEEAAGIMLAENTARHDLDVIDEAGAYARRMEEFEWSAEVCARRAGVHPQRVRRRVRLLTLEATIQTLVRSGQLPIGYAEFLAEVGIPYACQLRAVAAMRDEARPTLDWFRSVVNAIAEQANQVDMFDPDDFLTAQRVSEPTVEAFLLPLPAKHRAPVIGDTAEEILANQAAYWGDAAVAWDRLGKGSHAYQCRILSLALTHAGASVQTQTTHVTPSLPKSRGAAWLAGIINA